MNTLNHPILLIPVVLWLAVCVFYDIRSRQVPMLLSLVPLVLAGAWRLILGGWIPVVLVVTLALISDLPKKAWRIPVGIMVASAAILLNGLTDALYSLIVIASAWVMWESGATGGADAKIIMALVLLFGNGWLFVPILLAGGVVGLIGLAARQKEIAFTISIAAGTLVWLFISH